MKPYPRSTFLIRFDFVMCLACIAFFIFWPNFDLSVSQYFYDNGNHRFFGSYYFIFNYVHDLTTITGATIIITLFGLISFSWLVKKGLLKRRVKVFIFLLCAFILGPGLLVNSTFKSNWGRPRPRQVIEFGGSNDYRSPLDPSFGQSSCQSFVCGDASVGYFFFSLALLFKKRKWLWLSTFAGSVLGVSRMIQGAHFFSDVLFSGWVVWFSSHILYTLFFEYRTHSQIARILTLKPVLVWFLSWNWNPLKSWKGLRRIHNDSEKKTEF